MNARKILDSLYTCGVPVMVTIYPGYTFTTNAEMIVGKPLEPQSSYLTFFQDHLCQRLVKNLGNPDSIVYQKDNEFIYFLWKIE